jgi:hypothetical protein
MAQKTINSTHQPHLKTINGNQKRWNNEYIHILIKPTAKLLRRPSRADTALPIHLPQESAFLDPQEGDQHQENEDNKMELEQHRFQGFKLLVARGGVEIGIVPPLELVTCFHVFSPQLPLNQTCKLSPLNIDSIAGDAEIRQAAFRSLQSHMMLMSSWQPPDHGCHMCLAIDIDIM